MSISELPQAELNSWQPWTIGIAGKPMDTPLLVGRLYARLSDDDLEPALSLLRAKPSEWPWIEYVIHPIEHDAVVWAKRFDEMEGRVGEFRLQVDAAIERPKQPEESTSSESLNQQSAGFLGGSELADALGIPETRRGAFFQQLGRLRKKLGDDRWIEVSSPGSNRPKFLYDISSPQLRELAESYKST